jgi:DNA-binding transcriptional LysR family regulator
MLPAQRRRRNSNVWICHMSQRDIRSLDIGMLRTFDALMRERSVSRAAARLFLSQPAVSASLNRLREVFGDPLFTRTSHGVVPTPRAQALAPQVEDVLRGLSALLDTNDAFDPARSSRVFRIAGSDHASRMLLPGLAGRLVALGSGIRIVWVPPGTWPLAEHLAKGELDLAVIARINPPRDLEMRTLYQDHYVFVTRKGHPLATQPLTLDSFCDTPQVFLGYGTATLDDLVDDLLARATRLPRTAAWSLLHNWWTIWPKLVTAIWASRSGSPRSPSPALARSSTSCAIATMLPSWAAAWRESSPTACTSSRCLSSCPATTRWWHGTSGLAATRASSGSRTRWSRSWPTSQPRQDRSRPGRIPG